MSLPLGQPATVIDRRYKASPLQGAGDGKGVGIRTGVLAGADADVADFEAERAGHRDAQAEGPADIELPVIGCNIIDGGLAAIAEARTGTEPQTGPESMDQVALADQIDIFLQLFPSSIRSTGLKVMSPPL